MDIIETTEKWEHLSKRYKNEFSFRLSTTSYIYPANIIPNVRMLAPYLDEIELVLFQGSHREYLPSRDDIDELDSIARDHELVYNVHLPVDIFPGDPDPETRNHAVDTIEYIVSLTSPLNPTTYTLHFSLKDKMGRDFKDKKKWKEAVWDSAKKIASMGIPPGIFSIETLEYPFSLVDDVVETLGFSICLDLGHIILYRHPMELYVEKYLDKTSIIHIHGVRGQKDHLSLDLLDRKMQATVASVLKGFNGTVSVEVFSFENLRDSLRTLEDLFT